MHQTFTNAYESLTNYGFETIENGKVLLKLIFEKPSHRWPNCQYSSLSTFSYVTLRQFFIIHTVKISYHIFKPINPPSGLFGNAFKQILKVILWILNFADPLLIHAHIFFLQLGSLSYYNSSQFFFDNCLSSAPYLIRVKMEIS